MGRVPKSTSLKGKHTMAMTMLAKGMAVKDVARELAVTPDAIYSWQKWPVFQEAQNRFIASIAREELDRGIQDANVRLHEHAGAIVDWMTSVILGETELKPNDQKRWRFALDFLHHAGIVDKQAMLKAEMPAQPSFTLNQTLDQRKQAILASGNEALQAQLERFHAPNRS